MIEEFDQTEDVTLLTRCMPILSGGPDNATVTGGVLLLRDVTEVRKRDRLLLSKDAACRAFGSVRTGDFSIAGERSSSAVCFLS